MRGAFRRGVAPAAPGRSHWPALLDSVAGPSLRRRPRPYSRPPSARPQSLVPRGGQPQPRPPSRGTRHPAAPNGPSGTGTRAHRTRRPLHDADPPAAATVADLVRRPRGRAPPASGRRPPCHRRRDRSPCSPRSRETCRELIAGIRPRPSACPGPHRHRRHCPGSSRGRKLRGVLAERRRRRPTASTTCPRPTGTSTTTTTPTRRRPDKTYSHARRVPPRRGRSTPWSSGCRPTSSRSPTVLQLLSLVVARDLLADAGAAESPWYDASRTGVVLGITGARPADRTRWPPGSQTPVLKEVVRSCGLTATGRRARSPRSSRHGVRAVGGELLPRSAGQRGRGPDRQPARPRRHQLHGRRRLRQLARPRSGLAISELLDGRADMMLTGGVDTENTIFMYMCFSKTPALSKSGDCRPFADERRRHPARRGHRHARAAAASPTPSATATGSTR